MSSETTALKIAKDFFAAWFTQRDLELASSLLGEDANYVGTTFVGMLKGRAKFTKFIERDLADGAPPYTISCNSEFVTPVSPGCLIVTLDFQIENHSSSLRLRADVSVSDGKIAYVHLSIPTHTYGLRADTPVTIGRQAVAISRQKLLDDEVSGAMFGAYAEPGLPVYFLGRTLLEMLGFGSEEEFLVAHDSSFISAVHPGDRELVNAQLSSIPTGGGDVSFEFRLERRGGDYVWLHCISRVTATHEGRVAYVSVCFDVSSRIAAQEKYTQRLRDGFERELQHSASLSAPNLIARVLCNVSQNSTQFYYSLSDRFDSLENRTLTGGIAALARSAADANDRAAISETFDRERLISDHDAGKTEYRMEYPRLDREGCVVWCRTIAKSYKRPLTEELMLFIYSYDITDERVQSKIVHDVLNSNYDYIMLVNLESDAIEKTLGPNAGSYPFTADGSFTLRLKNALIEMSKVSNLSFDEMYAMHSPEAIRRELTVRDQYAVSSPYPSEDGRVLHKRWLYRWFDVAKKRVLVSRSDVTDVFEYERSQQLALAAALTAAQQSSAAKSDFLSRMSHEIRTPLNAIIGMSAIAAQSAYEPATVSDCIKKIGISSRFLLALLNDILDMNRIESGSMLLKNEKFPAEEFIQSVSALAYSQSSAKNVDFECLVDTTVSEFYVGDALKLQQVLVNVLSNAFKFTPPGGKVTFSVCERSRSEGHVVLRFVINDTGIGIAEEFLPRIFEPFTQENGGNTSSYGGTGLGLAISKSIVDMMNGNIAISSIKGIGTEFTIDVTLGASGDEPARKSKTGAHSFAHLKTLVVDDDVVVCESAIRTLREIGISAEWVDSGRQAVERVEQRMRLKQFYDMVLIDWKMPDMDGIETTRQIRRIVGPDVTIIIITAYDWPSIEDAARAAGANMLMSKPLFKSSLISVFSHALGERCCVPEPYPAEFDFGGKRVLVVEDNELNSEVAGTLLKNKGFSVEYAENGLRALELFSRSEPGYYDAILMDVRMPIMDGLQATGNIRHMSNADAKTIPIIAMTANAFDDDIRKSLAAGMNAHLAKPVEPQRLYKTLYDYIFSEQN